MQPVVGIVHEAPAYASGSTVSQNGCKRVKKSLKLLEMVAVVPEMYSVQVKAAVVVSEKTYSQYFITSKVIV